MPGKVNPTQCESLTQVCLHIFWEQYCHFNSWQSGPFPVERFNPMMAFNFLQSVKLMTDAAISF